MSNPHAQRCDVAIAGGGLVGATLALALARLDLAVVLIEASPFGSAGQPSFDDRTTALSNGSRRIFTALEVWPLLEREATPIRRIHISDQGRFGFARIDAGQQGLQALGHVAINRAIGAALWRRLQQTSVRIIAPARVKAMRCLDDQQQVECELGDGKALLVEARLAIAADGVRSVLRESGGVGAETWDYRQTALVSNVLTQRFHDHVAYERFTPAGPLALLPMSEGRIGLIWTFDSDAAPAMAQLADADFIERLQRAFGFRLGRFMRV
ncbi:MAG: FAD-dependent monooxygenase, partial [Steroidobacteraceae bacterium]